MIPKWIIEECPEGPFKLQARVINDCDAPMVYGNSHAEIVVEINENCDNYMITNDEKIHTQTDLNDLQTRVIQTQRSLLTEEIRKKGDEIYGILRKYGLGSSELQALKFDRSVSGGNVFVYLEGHIKDKVERDKAASKTDWYLISNWVKKLEQQQKELDQLKNGII